jgi:hypothetical protein
MRSARFERATFGSGGQRSIQLSYERSRRGREANKPSSVSSHPDPLGRMWRRRIISLGRPLLTASSSLPGTLRSFDRLARAAPHPLFGLAPSGVCRAVAVTSNAVVSYTTVSPLPVPVRVIGGLFSVALSVVSRRPAVSRHSTLWSSDFPQPRIGGRDPHSLPILSISRRLI